jgi:hypothetical protein
MSEVNQRPSDIGQTVQPDMRIGTDPEGEEDRTDRRGQESLDDRDRDRRSERSSGAWPQQRQQADEPMGALSGPETLDDANSPR